MYLRMISLILALMIVVSPVSASETTMQGLKTIYEEYHYALTVEWDQKDRNFAKSAEAKFKEGLEELQKQGMTNEELVMFAAAQFKDEKVKADFNNLMLVMKLNSLSTAEVNKMVNDIVKESYQRGASWNGDVATNVVIGVVVAGFIALIVGLVVSCAVNDDCNSSSSSSDGTGSDWDDDWSDDWCTETYVCDYYYDEYGEWSDCYYECW